MKNNTTNRRDFLIKTLGLGAAVYFASSSVTFTNLINDITELYAEADDEGREYFLSLWHKLAEKKRRQGQVSAADFIDRYTESLKRLGH